jgi:cation-transporting ATPase 13A2
VSLSAALYNTRTTQQNLRDTIVSSEAVNVFRPGGKTVMVMSTDLVPGDLIEVPDHGCQMLCDAVLLEGQAIMNESMLTGESVPITKTSIVKEQDVVYTSREHEKHTLKCGTQVIQTRKYKNQTVKAVVIRTGYLTSKGDLVRSILYPPPVDFQFESDSYKFILVLGFIATLGMAYTLAKASWDDFYSKYIKAYGPLYSALAVVFVAE